MGAIVVRKHTVSKVRSSWCYRLPGSWPYATIFIYFMFENYLNGQSRFCPSYVDDLLFAESEPTKVEPTVDEDSKLATYRNELDALFTR